MAARPTVNWAALLVVIALVGAFAWIVKSPAERPLAETSDATMTDPHGMMMGGSPHGSMSMEDVTRRLEDGKAKLAQNPLDVAVLSELYSMYGMIGQADKMRPYAEAAVAAWKNRGENNSEALRTLAGIAMAAMQNGDHSGAALALIAYSEADPDNHGVVASIGNLYFEVSHEQNAKGDAKAAREAAAEAVRWYDRYLAAIGTENQDQDYWNVVVDRASMQLLVAKADPSSAAFKDVLDTLTDVTVHAPDNWGAWHNLGLARDLAGQKSEAAAALTKAAELAGDQMRRWESEKELARIEGREAPPMPVDPADPHAGMNMGGSGMSNPHGGMSGPHGGMSNPHEGAGT